MKIALTASMAVRFGAKIHIFADHEEDRFHLRDVNNNIAYAKSLSQSPRAYLDFFQNLGSDGLPPVSPKEFAKMIADAPIKDILKIITAFSSDGPNAAILAKLDVER